MGDHRQLQQQGTDSLDLPPGFRFHPSDEEIIIFYLMPKVLQRGFTCTAIGEVDLNKTEPWDLAEKAKMMGEKDYYFFYQKDRKYPSGMRANRATEGGYWKATGKDKEIYRAMPGVGMMPLLVGMKKTLVFYKGRAPKGSKTSWVMYEYRLDGSGRLPNPTSSSTSSDATVMSTSKDEWVVCRVFHKTSGVVKNAPAPLSYPVDMGAADGDIDQANIPLPMSMQFPILPDFTMDPLASFYSTAGASSSSVPPLMPAMASMGSADLQVNNAMFRNLMAPPPLPMPFVHQMGMGVAGAGGFMVVPESMPSSMLSHKDTGMSPDQTHAIDISSMVSTIPLPTDTMGMDGMWKY